MKQKLCKKCEFLWFQLYDYITRVKGVTPETIRCDRVPTPFIHCHHEEEPEGCEVCLTDGIYIKYYKHFIHSGQQTYALTAKFCPNCGRELT